jgi:hypothetical protein
MRIVRWLPPWATFVGNGNVVSTSPFESYVWIKCPITKFSPEENICSST